MNELTPRQQEILGFIQQSPQNQGVTPSFRDMARHFGFRNMSSVVDHVRVLRRKGALTHQLRRARSLQVAERFGSPPDQGVDSVAESGSCVHAGILPLEETLLMLMLLLLNAMCDA